LGGSLLLRGCSERYCLRVFFKSRYAFLPLDFTLRQMHDKKACQ
jgi:hypothetical protein